MKKIKSNEKGKRGELEAAKEWTGALGRAVRRGLSQSGGAIESDLVGVPGHWVEVKYLKSIAALRHLDQAKRDSAAVGGGVPVACVRENGGGWAVLVDLTVYATLLKTVSDKLGEGCLVELRNLVDEPSKTVKRKPAKRVAHG